jgi:hypothetical protein
MYHPTEEAVAKVAGIHMLLKNVSQRKSLGNHIDKIKGGICYR